MKLEILATTMNGVDFSKIEKMKINSDVVFANQCDRDGFNKIEFNGHIAKMISTTSRGLSRNRNIALAHSNQNADLILFLDDDLVLNDAYENLIIEEFEKHPEADAIKFNIHDLSDIRKISMKKTVAWKKCTRRNMSASGVCGLVIKRKTIERYSLRFHENFGAGTDNYCGEDTIFLQNLINLRIRAYLSPVDIAGIDQSESTWFKGYDEKYFTVSGKVLATIYPRLCRILAVRSAYRFSKRPKCKMKFHQILKCYNRGIKEILGEK